METTGSLPHVFTNPNRRYAGSLEPYFKVLLLAPNVHLPYHNLRHMLHVAWLCYDAAEYFRKMLSLEQRRTLIIAALFHDYDHTGTGLDCMNIDRAVHGMKQHLLPEDRDFEACIERIIRSTEYPHREDVCDHILCGIAQDADLAQALHPAWLQQVIGLGTELHRTPAEMLRAQPDFLRSISWKTAWARDKFPPSVIAEKVRETERLIALL